jgi:Winged helix-turn-helix DNA-binding
MSDLVELARRYVAASDELESLRSEIRRAVMNGGAPTAEPKANPSSPAARRAAGQRHHPNAIQAAKIDQKVLDLLKATPGLKVGELAKATGLKTSTTSERLRRMRAGGSVAAVEGGGWSASPASP